MPWVLAFPSPMRSSYLTDGQQMRCGIPLSGENHCQQDGHHAHYRAMLHRQICSRDAGERPCPPSPGLAPDSGLALSPSLCTLGWSTLHRGSAGRTRLPAMPGLTCMFHVWAPVSVVSPQCEARKGITRLRHSVQTTGGGVLSYGRPQMPGRPSVQQSQANICLRAPGLQVVIATILLLSHPASKFPHSHSIRSSYISLSNPEPTITPTSVTHLHNTT
ncbi:uncharacterized protein B0I36DRAFT_159366 [Microdochium trichocladiopsis]|uniref:Uncharacterized protein n=1 Tax=Microdochium trichocladiopsis TaxID=1682393 RepID=A0A9P8Y0K0_9PEZI|nr:uncharacterized protein B0I36DRAFT_159366 [Microdochium trichocladiopsis]KAH7026508.1 hypothetical protein B0I36DRAFT_159366 [Microdochium trichocladiopsis]